MLSKLFIKIVVIWISNTIFAIYILPYKFIYMDNYRNEIHCVCLTHENISDTFIEVLFIQCFLSWLSNDVNWSEYQRKSSQLSQLIMFVEFLQVGTSYNSIYSILRAKNSPKAGKNLLENARGLDSARASSASSWIY